MKAQGLSTKGVRGPAQPPAIASAVGRLARAIDGEVPAGDVAELRRLSPDDAFSPAFLKLAADFLELPDGGAAREEQERLWSIVVNALAIMKGMHEPRVPLGRSLAEAGMTELRFVKLLRARGQRLATEVRGAARFLASKGCATNLTDLAHLVLTDGSKDLDTVRRRVANEYYRNYGKPKPTNR